MNNNENYLSNLYKNIFDINKEYIDKLRNKLKNRLNIISELK